RRRRATVAIADAVGETVRAEEIRSGRIDNLISAEHNGSAVRAVCAHTAQSQRVIVRVRGQGQQLVTWYAHRQVLLRAGIDIDRNRRPVRETLAIAIGSHDRLDFTLAQSTRVKA